MRLVPGRRYRAHQGCDAHLLAKLRPEQLLLVDRYREVFAFGGSGRFEHRKQTQRQTNFPAVGQFETLLYRASAKKMAPRNRGAIKKF